MRRPLLLLLTLVLALSACSTGTPTDRDASAVVRVTQAAVPTEALPMYCGERTFNISCPAGWTGKTIDPTNVAIYSEDRVLTGDYYYFQDQFTWADVLNLAQINADYLKSVDRFVSQGAGPAIEGYQTWALIGLGQSYYYALGSMGDGMLMVGVYDFSGTDDASELLPWFLSLINESSTGNL